jgi:hypothetical protein
MYTGRSVPYAISFGMASEPTGNPQGDLRLWETKLSSVPRNIGKELGIESLMGKESRHWDKARNIREGQTHTYERGCSSNNIGDVRNVCGVVLCTSAK